jgi:hypothetical protein
MRASILNTIYQMRCARLIDAEAQISEILDAARIRRDRDLTAGSDTRKPAADSAKR